MAAPKDAVKLQLNLKAGNDLFNVYAVSAHELVALVDDLVKVAPAIAQRFGIKSSVGVAAEPKVAAAVAPKVEQASTDAEAAAAGPAVGPAEKAAAPLPTASAPTSEDGEALSPREKARLRLKGGK